MPEKKKYKSFEVLRDDYTHERVAVDEYLKYFARLTGVEHHGYPDFSDDFMKLAGAGELQETRRPKARKVKSVAEDKARKAAKLRCVVVSGSCTGDGDILHLKEARIFNTRAEARKFISSVIKTEGGVFINLNTAYVQGDKVFVLVDEAK